MAKRLDGKIKTPNSGPKIKSKSDARQAEQLKQEEKALLAKKKKKELKILEHQVTLFTLIT